MNKRVNMFTYKNSKKDIRLDFKWHNPKFYDFIKNLKKISKNEGLITSTLIDEVTINGGKRLPKGISHLLSEFDPYPYVKGSSCLNNLQIDFNECSNINHLIYDKVKCKNLIDEDILISIAGTIGRLGYFDSSDLDEKISDKVKFSENLALLRKRKSSKIVMKNLLYYLHSPLSQIQFERMYGGSEQYKLSLSLLKNTMIFFPKEKKDQEEITDKTDKNFRESIKNEKKADEELNNIDKRIEKHLPISFPEAILPFYYKKLSSIGDRIDYYANHPYLQKLRKQIKKTDYRKMKDLVKPQKSGKVTPQDYYCIIDLVDCIDEKTGELIQIKELPMLGSQNVICRNGEILISGLQPQKGKIIIIDESTEGCIASSEFFPFKIISNEITPDYLKLILRSDIVSKQWEYQLTGCTPSRARIGSNDILETLVPIIEDQDTLVKEVNEIKLKSKKYKENAIEKKDKVLIEYVETLTSNKEIFETIHNINN